MTSKHSKENEIRFGPLGPNCLHICVDMQRIFAEDTDWNTPWMSKVLPLVTRTVEAHPDKAVFTRFITLARPEEGKGTWKRYYERWRSLTTERMSPEMMDLVEPLKDFVPPGEVVDKLVYSPWLDGHLEERLRARHTDTLIVTGGETDVCVLATVLGAVDRGYRTIIVEDALCSSSDETHDALMLLYRSRYGQQVETVSTDLLLDAWR
jgi:nicotinamidase-related amidase